MNIFYYWAKLLKKIRGVAVKDSVVHATAKLESGTHFVTSSIGKHSFVGYDCEIVNTEIGSFCSIANGVVIGGGMHPIDWVSTSPVFYSGRDSVKAKFSTFDRPPVKKTVVGHDVWIGQNVLVKQGVIIGTGAVVGMGSVVTKDVLPYSIVAGNPAKFIRNRFDDDVISSLLDSCWWNFSEELLAEYAKKIRNPDLFLNEIPK